jgi:NTP pyrophosphatase (non-canonical NTP hydrolase)
MAKRMNILDAPPITHQALVTALCKDGQQIKDEISYLDAHLLHMILGLSGEVGELLDALKKAIIYRKELDIVNAVEELGDIEFYLEGLRQGLNLTREQCLLANIKKLTNRYSGIQYTNEAATERVDKSKTPL